MRLIKKVDKIVLKSFIGPFILTMLVVIFILLTQHMLKYFDDLVGKDLGWSVLGQLIFYFAIFVTPFAFPLGVLLSSLMTFGTLGEHSELTAIKSGGISLPRTMRSIFIFVLFITGLAFVSNNYFVPKAALEAYSLMWDIKRKKPSLDLPEGEFYGGLENYRIRVTEKDKDGETLKGLIIYDHSDRTGNNEVTIAETGRMTTIMNERYLKLELYNGHSYMEGTANKDNVSRGRKELSESFSIIKFDESELVFDLTSFDLERTEKELFSRNRLMRNLGEIKVDIDSLIIRTNSRKIDFFNSKSLLFNYSLRNDSVRLPKYLEKLRVLKDSLYQIKEREREISQGPEPGTEGLTEEQRDSIRTARAELMRKKNEEIDRKAIEQDKITTFPKSTSGRAGKQLPVIIDTTKKSPEEIRLEVLRLDTLSEIEQSVNEASLAKVRQIKGRIFNDAEYMERNALEMRIFNIQYHKIIANAVACLVMFLIGAPLGSIIKKGGLGIPVLISIFFFIIYYVLIILGEKWTKSGLVYAWAGIWAPNMILFPVGLLFLLQARKDARIFEGDFYNVVFIKIKKFAVQLWRKWKKS